MRGSVWWGLLAVLFVLGVVSRLPIMSAFVMVLALATGASALWAKYCLNGVSYRRRLGSEAISHGAETTLTLEFINAKPLPLPWLVVRDACPQQVHLVTGELRRGALQRAAQLVNVLPMRWYERVTRTHRLVGVQRGHFDFGPATITSGDVFGFQRREQTDERIATLVVYPRVVPVEALGLPVGRPMGDWFARRQVVQDPLRYALVRDYVPGDNPRHIHWKATARLGQLQVKVFEPSDTLSVTIAVDVQTLPLAYEYVPEHLELVISAAASLALHALGERHMVGLCSNSVGRDGRLWTRVTPGRSPEQAQHLLTVLAGLSAFRGRALATMLYEIMPLLPYGGTLAAITAMPGGAVYEALLALERAGHPTLLLTVGGEAPAVPERQASYHLGGKDAWRQLESLALA